MNGWLLTSALVDAATVGVSCYVALKARQDVLKLLSSLIVLTSGLFLFVHTVMAYHPQVAMLQERLRVLEPSTLTSLVRLQELSSINGSFINLITIWLLFVSAKREEDCETKRKRLITQIEREHNSRS